MQYKINKGVDIHQEEINYYKLLDILPIVQEKYRSGVLKEKRYQEWMARFTALEKRYG